MVAAAVIGSAVIGGAISSDSSRSASNKAADATKNANDLQKYQYDTTRADNAPLMQTRNSALANINALMVNPTAGVQKDPGYQFMLDQGIKARNNAASASGMLFSGSQAKALDRYGTDYADTKYTDILNRYNAVAGLGQAASGANALAGSNYANNVGNNLTNLANVQGAASLNNGNIWANGINQLGAYGSRNGWFDWSKSGGGGTVPGLNGSYDPGGDGGYADFYSSDIRLKTNIRRIGTTPRGFNAYSWDWKDGSGSSMGVIAQEVQAIEPSAVAANDATGFLKVNYGRV